jgi:predicted enzyme related to lactoylglutathione lyase
VQPYFDEEFYVGFSVKGYELGLDPNERGVEAGPGGSVAYWGVANADEGVKHFLGAGATLKTAVTDVGGGIRVATVADPFGNLIGIIENPSFRAE